MDDYLEDSIKILKINLMVFLSLLFLVIIMKGKKHSNVFLLTFPLSNNVEVNLNNLSRQSFRLSIFFVLNINLF